MFNYDVDALLSMAQEYLEAEERYRVFLLTFKGGWVYNIDTVEYGNCVQYETESSATYNALFSACKVVRADPLKVIGMAKAMNRYEKRERWQKCATIGWSNLAYENARRYLAAE